MIPSLVGDPIDGTILSLRHDPPQPLPGCEVLRLPRLSCGFQVARFLGERLRSLLRRQRGQHNIGAVVHPEVGIREDLVLFWAAKFLMRFTREELQAIVGTAEFVDADQAQYFLDVLIDRQQKTGKLGINGLNPLDGFTVRGNRLEFENLSERYEFVHSDSTAYRIAWSLYDNAAASARHALGSPEAHQTTGSRLPEPDRYLGDRNLLLLAQITSTHADHPVWEQPVRVYLRSTGSSYEVVGIERDSLRAYVPMQ